jgi:hypothetical protein
LVQVLELSGGGFQLLKDTLVSYKSLATKPSTDIEKINTWVLQQSKVAGTNFGPYYKAWNWPVSDATMATLASLNLKAFPIPNNFNMASPPPLPSPSRPPLSPMPPLVVPIRCEDYATLTKGGSPASACLRRWAGQVMVLHAAASGMLRSTVSHPIPAVLVEMRPGQALTNDLLLLCRHDCQ